jgi:hypothetical protein
MAKAKNTNPADKMEEKATVNDGPATFPDFPDGWNPNEWQRASCEIWRPETGEFIMGLYDGSKLLDKELTDFDEDVTCHYIIDHESGNRWSFVGGVMCDKFINEAGIQKGMQIYVAYMGQGETRKGNKVNNFDIRFKP